MTHVEDPAFSDLQVDTQVQHRAEGNHRCWFTTWRRGTALAAMLVMGAVLKLAMLA